MIIGFSKYSGTDDGGGRRAVNYMLAEQWTKTVEDKKVLERRTPAPEILRGDPDQIRAAIAAIPHKHKYTSGVFSFESGDVLVAKYNAGDPVERAKVDAVIDDFEDAVFAGLPRSHRPPVLWSTHTHTGRLEVNFITPRAVAIGDRLYAINIAPHPTTTRRLTDALRDKHNAANGWADPEDPARARPVSLPDHEQKIRAAAKRLEGKSRRVTEETISKMIVAQVDAGAIDSRAQVRAFLVSQGFDIARETKRSITITEPGKDMRIRLEGKLYEAAFSGADWRAAHAGQQSDARAAEMATAPKRLVEAMDKRAKDYAPLVAKIDALSPQASEPIDPAPTPRVIRFKPLINPPTIDQETADVRLRSRDQTSRPRPGARSSAAAAEADAQPSPYRPDPRGVPLPRLVQDRRKASRSTARQADDLRDLSRFNVERRGEGPAMLLQADARRDLGDRRAEHLERVRRPGRGADPLRGRAAREARQRWGRDGVERWQARAFDSLYDRKLSEQLGAEIRYIDRKSRSIRLRDGAMIEDHGDRITTSRVTDTAAALMIAEAQAKGWTAVKIEGAKRDREKLWLELRKAGLEVVGHEPSAESVQELERWRSMQSAQPEQQQEASDMKPSSKARFKRATIDKDEMKRQADAIKQADELRPALLDAGYIKNKSKSSSGSHRYDHANGSSVVVSRNGKSDQWKFFDLNDAQFHGSAYDVVMRYRGLDFIQAHAYLRGEAVKPIEQRPAKVALVKDPPPKRTEDGQARAEAEWMDAIEEPRNSYLTTRYITAEFQIDPRFRASVRTLGPYGNAAFAYVDEAGELVGVEQRNAPTKPGGKSFRRYTEGGVVGQWRSEWRPDDTALVFVESPIDAMAHFAELPPERRNHVRYATVRQGKPEDMRAAIEVAVRALPAGGAIVGACDKDDAGEAYNRLVKEVAEASGFRYTPHQPTSGKDWAEARAIRVHAALAAQRKAAQDAAAAAPAPAPTPSPYAPTARPTTPTVAAQPATATKKTPQEQIDQLKQIWAETDAGSKKPGEMSAEERRVFDAEMKYRRETMARLVRQRELEAQQRAEQEQAQTGGRGPRMR